MSVDWVLIVVIVIMTVALLIANVYILVYFQHDDDKNTAYFPKILVVRDCMSTFSTASRSCANTLDIVPGLRAVLCRSNRALTTSRRGA